MFVSTDDALDAPSSLGSPKVALLPPVLKKVPSDKEREGQGSPQPSPRTISQEGRKCFSPPRSPPGDSFQEKGIKLELNEQLSVDVSIPWAKGWNQGSSFAQKLGRRC